MVFAGMVSITQSTSLPLFYQYTIKLQKTRTLFVGFSAKRALFRISTRFSPKINGFSTSFNRVFNYLLKTLLTAIGPTVYC